jgi:hypothetical protein
MAFCEEEFMVTFLSGFNQMFLSYLLLTAFLSIAFEGQAGAHIRPSDMDYDFEIESGLSRGSGHPAIVGLLTMLVLGTVSAILAGRIIRNRRSIDLQIYDFNSNRH